MKPYVKTQFSALCNMKTPITTNLFGDDLLLEIKKCEMAVKNGKYVPSFRRNVNRGFPHYNRSNYQGQSVGPMRGRGRVMNGYCPYMMGNWSQSNFGYGGQYGQFGHQHQITKKKSQTASTSAATPGTLAVSNQPSLN